MKREKQNMLVIICTVVVVVMGGIAVIAAKVHSDNLVLKYELERRCKEQTPMWLWSTCEK